MELHGDAWRCVEMARLEVELPLARVHLAVAIDVHVAQPFEHIVPSRPDFDVPSLRTLHLVEIDLGRAVRKRGKELLDDHLTRCGEVGDRRGGFIVRLGRTGERLSVHLLRDFDGVSHAPLERGHRNHLLYQLIKSRVVHLARDHAKIVEHLLTERTRRERVGSTRQPLRGA